MWKITGKKIVVLAAIAVLSGCHATNWQDIFNGKVFRTNNNVEYYQTTNTPLRQPQSVVVCRSRQCAPAKLSMTREYIYNSLVHLFENNNHKTALICQADADSRTCIENYISMPLKVGMTPAYMYIDSVNVTDVIIGRKNQQINLVLNYNVTYNGLTPDCTPAKSVSFVRNTHHIMLEDIGYRCKMTTIGHSTVKTVLAIDYIDLDFGFIGGYYSIGVSGPAHGGGHGYMLIRMPETIENLTAVWADQPVETQKAKKPKMKKKQQPKQQDVAAQTEQKQKNQRPTSRYQEKYARMVEGSETGDKNVKIFPLEQEKQQVTTTKSVQNYQWKEEKTDTQEAEAQKTQEEVKDINPEKHQFTKQIAPTTYTITSGNKLAEELQKAQNKSVDTKEKSLQKDKAFNEKKVK